MTKKMSFLTVMVLGLIIFLAPPSQAASVNCMFMSGDEYSTKDGAWLGSADPVSVMELFGMEGLTLKVSTALLGKLDSKQPFFAGDSKQGKVYLMGGDMGIMGKAVAVREGKIVVYDGGCSVSFG